MYTINAATGGLGNAGTTTTTRVLPTSVAVDPFGKFAYTTHEILIETPTQNVLPYVIDGTTGALTPVSAPDGVGSNPASIVVDPSGRFAYVANQASNDVSIHAINAGTGALTWTGSVPAGVDPSSVAVDPSGRFAYVANSYVSNPGSGSISAYSISAGTGALIPVGAAITSGPNPTCITVDPSARFVYVTHANGVGSYVISAATGALINASAASAGTDPRSITVEPTGRFAYVANGGGNVSAFTINATTGVLTSFATVTAGDQPRSITVDPSGKFAFVANLGSGNVSVYAINTTSGALTEIGTMAAETGPISVVTAGTIQ